MCLKYVYGNDVLPFGEFRAFSFREIAIEKYGTGLPQGLQFGILAAPSFASFATQGGFLSLFL